MLYISGFVLEVEATIQTTYTKPTILRISLGYSGRCVSNNGFELGMVQKSCPLTFMNLQSYGPKVAQSKADQ